MNLTQLANYYKSDKGNIHGEAHNYTKIYEQIFACYRDKPINILEIGLNIEYSWRPDTYKPHHCPSLQMWKAWFKNANIYGFDIQDFSHIKEDRIKIFRGDQGKKKDFKKLLSKCSEFDIIIDDGSHRSDHQQISLGVLFPYLKNNGIYVIEDTHYHPPDEKRIKSTLAVFKKYVNSGVLESEVLNRKARDYLKLHIDTCHFECPDPSGRNGAPGNMPEYKLIYIRKKASIGNN